MRREIYELLEAMSRAESLGQVYQSAMHYICSTLGCSRVSILLFDDRGNMRFVASQGLSEPYRKAIEGHSPWPADAADPRPFCIPDVETTELKLPLLVKNHNEGIRALGFIPLAYEGQLLGKFMIYFDAPHDFTPDELRLAQGIATQLAAAIHRRRSAEALRQSEERYRAVVEQVKDYAIFSTDTQGRPTSWNEGVRRILGFDKSEFVNRNILERVFTPEDIQQKIPERELETAARAGTANDTRWMLRKDGSRFWADGVTTAIRNHEGKLIGFSRVFRDSTAARETEQKLAGLRHWLDQEVQQRTASLKETMRSFETLLYTIAHDLRAPNRAMRGYAELLADAHANQLDEEGKFFVKRIGEAALRNEALIRDLLEYGRLSHAELPCGPVDPGEIVRSSIQAFDFEILAKKAGLDVSDRWPLVTANEATLSHVVTNLLANALKYNRPGVPPRVRIFPEPANGVDGQQHDCVVRLCVRDNGIGVPPDQREMIFEPFQRASNANDEGTGMGLAIVRKAAERMGGRAGVDSNSAEGSTFWVELRKRS
jgi:PAS domain S-box-containing protein